MVLIDTPASLHLLPFRAGLVDTEAAVTGNCRQFGAGANPHQFLMIWFTSDAVHRGNLKDWKFTTINARAEAGKTTRSYKDSFAQRLYLVSASSWYEWTGEKGSKTWGCLSPR